ncbi:hypothetical protein [Streptomyces sp. NPDC048172]|uniref:hypothetical protein n=1 Tax=Streptomyces sp. NPDC048172 TaxID=3365505 RepID=UPI0037247B55
MSQQLAIIVLVDVANALRSRTLRGNTYLFDNMKLQGSENQGTPDLVTAINGTYWMDGSQANEQVLNWLPYGLGSIPPTVPKGYQAERVQQSDQQALDALAGLSPKGTAKGPELATELEEIKASVGARTAVKSPRRGARRPGQKIIDITGEIVPLDSPAATDPARVHQTPIITDVTGEAVDKNVIYPAEYGSPDMVTDGWYWSATVDSSRPGTYAYTMEIELHALTAREGELVWEPVRMTCESKIKVITEPKRNGFTKRGVGMLPVPPSPPPTFTSYGQPQQHLAQER